MQIQLLAWDSGSGRHIDCHDRIHSPTSIPIGDNGYWPFIVMSRSAGHEEDRSL